MTVTLPFIGLVVGSFAATIALLGGESLFALGAVLMVVYCAAEFVVNVDVT